MPSVGWHAEIDRQGDLPWRSNFSTSKVMLRWLVMMKRLAVNCAQIDAESVKLA